MLPNTFIEMLVYKLYHLTLYMYSITQSSGSTSHSSVRKSDQCPVLDQLQVHIFTAMYLHYFLLLILGMDTKTALGECS